MKLSLSEQLLECQRGLQFARMFHSVWSLLQVKSDNNWVDVQRAYPLFSTTVGVACFNSMILLLFRTLEEGGDKVSPYMLHVRMLDAGAISPEANGELEKHIDGIRPIWEKVAVLRHKSVAHFEPKVSQDMIYRCEDLSPKEVSNLLDCAAGYLASLEFFLTGRISVDFDGLDDELSAIMQTLEQSLS